MFGPLHPPTITFLAGALQDGQRTSVPSTPAPPASQASQQSAASRFMTPPRQSTPLRGAARTPPPAAGGPYAAAALPALRTPVPTPLLTARKMKQRSDLPPSPEPVYQLAPHPAMPFPESGHSWPKPPPQVGK